MNRIAYVFLLMCCVVVLNPGSARAEDSVTALHRANKLVDLARANLKETNYAKADYYYNRALVSVREHRPQSSSSPNILFQLGRLSADAGDRAKALEY